MTVVITGGTGTIGKRLSAMLVEKGYTVIILSRKLKAAEAGGKITYAKWDVGKEEIDVDALMHADYIIHLAGAGVAEGRWTNKRKQEIIDSRTKSSALLIKTLLAYRMGVRAVISASATGWYGADTPANTQSGFTEDAPPCG